MEKKSLKELKEEKKEAMPWAATYPAELIEQAESPAFTGEDIDKMREVQPLINRLGEAIVERAIAESPIPPLKETIKEDTKKLAEALQSDDIANWLEEVTHKMVSLLDPRQEEAFAEFCRGREAPYSSVLMSILRRACELRDFPYFPDVYWVHQKASNVKAKTFCENCHVEIPQHVARWGQKFCCNHCSAYANGSHLVAFDSHSEGCPLESQLWQGVTNPLGMSA